MKTELKEKHRMSLLHCSIFTFGPLIYIWATEKLIIKPSRGIWHVIGGWYKEKGSKKILRGRNSKGREGKDEPKHADW